MMQHRDIARKAVKELEASSSQARGRIGAKLASTRGDTLIEVLSALLVAVMAVTLMATMIMTATNVTSKNETRMAALYAAQSSLSVPQDADKYGALSKVTISGGGLSSARSVDVTAYKSEGFIRYSVSSTSAADSGDGE